MTDGLHLLRLLRLPPETARRIDEGAELAPPLLDRRVAELLQLSGSVESGKRLIRGSDAVLGKRDVGAPLQQGQADTSYLTLRIRPWIPEKPLDDLHRLGDDPLGPGPGACARTSEPRESFAPGFQELAGRLPG